MSPGTSISIGISMVGLTSIVGGDAAVNNLELETGDNFLLETGDLLLLEN